jgi:ubiquinone/menaquinone biosynthesis C-methylase UbiE
MADDVKAGVARMFDEMSGSYDQIVPLHTYFGARLVAAAGVDAGDRVLDVATGPGVCAIPAAAAVGAQGTVVGIDLSAEMIDRLSAAIAVSGLDHVHAKVMDAEALTFDDRSFDVVTCGFALFFFPDRMRALAEFARMLEPGGRIAFSTFANDALGYPWFVEVVTPYLPDDGVPRDAAARFLHVDIDELHEQLRRSGFESPVSEVVEGPFRFESPEQHWDWLMSNGNRFTIQRVDDADLAALRAALAERMEQHRDGDGFRFDLPSRFTVARRAG